MISIYLSSLYTMLFEKNPLVTVWKSYYKSTRALFRLRRNMVYAKYKLEHLEQQLQTVEAFIQTPTPQYRHRFDVRR